MTEKENHSLQQTGVNLLENSDPPPIKQKRRTNDMKHCPYHDRVRIGKKQIKVFYDCLVDRSLWPVLAHQGAKVGMQRGWKRVIARSAIIEGYIDFQTIEFVNVDIHLNLAEERKKDTSHAVSRGRLRDALAYYRNTGQMLVL